MAAFEGFSDDQFGFFARRGSDGATVPDPTTWRFDPSVSPPTGGWTPLPDWPESPGSQVAGFVAGDKPFIVNCCKNGGTWGTTFALEGGVWVEKNLSPPRGITARVGDDVYMVAPRDLADPFAAAGLYLYDPINDQWLDKAIAVTGSGIVLTGATRTGVAFVIDGKLYYGAAGRFGVYDPALDN